jgi:AcrR family transcriptional regulator
MVQMSARDNLLAEVMAHIASAGISDLSLRELAAAIGSSHRMLLYHFGSREGLMVAVVRAVEEQQRVFLSELMGDGSLSQMEIMRMLWRRLADPALWPNERLFFELYAQALQGRPGTQGMLDDVIDAWLTPGIEYAAQHGLDPERTRLDTRLGIAVVRGLLLDLLATQDRESVNAAYERFLELYFPGGTQVTTPTRGASQDSA